MARITSDCVSTTHAARWTKNQQNGPNHLGLCFYNACSKHGLKTNRMARITSDCVLNNAGAIDFAEFSSGILGERLGQDLSLGGKDMGEGHARKQAEWKAVAAARWVVAYSCSPYGYGQSLLQL